MILTISDKQTMIRALAYYSIKLEQMEQLNPGLSDDNRPHVDALCRLWAEDLRRHERAKAMSHDRNRRKRTRRDQRGPIQ